MITVPFALIGDFMVYFYGINLSVRCSRVYRTFGMAIETANDYLLERGHEQDG
jgi:hypothetical protein